MQGYNSTQVFDGDAWWTIRIRVVARLASDPPDLPIEDIPNDAAHEVRVVDSLSEIQAELLSGALDPAQLRIVRESVYAISAEGFDLDLVAAAISDDIGVDDVAVADASAAGRGDGFISVTPPDGSGQHFKPADDDGADLLRNIERLRAQGAGGKDMNEYGLFNAQQAGKPTIVRLNSLTFIGLSLGIGVLADPNGFGLSDIRFFWDTTNNDAISWSFTGAEPVDASPELVDIGGPGIRVAIGSGPVSVEGSAADETVISVAAVHAPKVLALKAMLGQEGEVALLPESTSSVAPNLSAEAVFTAAVVRGSALQPLLTINGTSGNDSISLQFADSGAVVFGGDGDDHITGSDWSDVIHGGAGNDVLHGGGGADQLFGEAGNDVLDGGAGRDQLFGGDGDDQIVFDAADDLDHVVGGSGTDTLLISGHQAPPVSFDLTAHEFEKAVAEQNDDEATEGWTWVSNTFAPGWVLESQHGTYGNGASWHVKYDIENKEDWSRKIEYTTATGLFAGDYILSDDGTAVATVNDAANDQAYESYVILFDKSGHKSSIKFYQDDGSSYDTKFDVDDEFDWESMSQYYDKEGQLDLLRTIFDDGHQKSDRFDVDDEFGWETLTDYIDKEGHKSGQDALFDDGNYMVAVFDTNDTETWKAEIKISDSDGNVLKHYFLFD